MEGFLRVCPNVPVVDSCCAGLEATELERVKFVIKGRLVIKHLAK